VLPAFPAGHLREISAARASVHRDRRRRAPL